MHGGDGEVVLFYFALFVFILILNFFWGELTGRGGKQKRKDGERSRIGVEYMMKFPKMVQLKITLKENSLKHFKLPSKNEWSF